MMGRPGSGRARKASISLPRSATTRAIHSNGRPPEVRATRCFRIADLGEPRRMKISTMRPSFEARNCAHLRIDVRSVERLSLGPGGEVRCQPGLEMFGDFLGGAVLGVADGAGAGKTLVAAWNIVGDPREGGASHHRFIGGDLDQVELCIDAIILVGG